MLKKINPNLALIYSTFLWGTWWYPVRLIDELANNNAIPLAGSFIIGGLIIGFFALKENIKLSKKNIYLTLAAGIFGGVAMGLYNEGLFRGSVGRVLIFFYLTVVWSTLIEVVFLNKSLTVYRGCSILSGFVGLFIMNQVDQGGLLPSSVADICAIISGMFWSIAATCLKINKDLNVLFATSTCIFTGAFFVILATNFPGGQELIGFNYETFKNTYILMLLFAFLWLIPAYYLTCYGSDQVDPGRAGVFMMFEVVVGICSAYLIANELISLRELIGGLFIMSAPLVELYSLKKDKFII